MMFTHYSTHVPADAMPRGATGSAVQSPQAEQPVVLIAFAKLVLMVAMLVTFMPLWLEMLGQLAYGPPPQAWGALRLLAVGGAGGFMILGLLILKVWTGLLKHLARAD